MIRLEGLMAASGIRDATPSDNAYFNLFSQSDQTQPDEIIEEVFLRMPTLKIRKDADAGQILHDLGINQVKQFYGESSLQLLSRCSVTKQSLMAVLMWPACMSAVSSTQESWR